MASFLNKALHSVKKSVSTVKNKDSNPLSLATNEHETQYEIAKANFERFHTTLVALAQHAATYIESTMIVMSRSAIISNELANILVEDQNENLFPQWSNSDPNVLPGQNTPTSSPHSTNANIGIGVSTLPPEQIERMKVLMKSNNDQTFLHTKRDLMNFLSSMRNSHQMFNVDSTFASFRATAQKALRGIQDEIDFHGKIFESISRRGQLREELVYYSNKVAQMEKDKLKKNGIENAKEREKFERNHSKREEIERTFTALTNDLIRQMNFQYANRGTVLLPFATNFYVSEENWCESFAAALQQVRASLPNGGAQFHQIPTLSNNLQQNLNISTGEHGGPPTSGQAPPPPTHIDTQYGAEPYNPFISPVNTYTPESDFVKNGRRPSMDKEANPYPYNDPNAQKAFY